MTAIFGVENSLNGWSVSFASPSQVLTATRLDEVLPLIEMAERKAIDGAYVALMLSYEAAPAFDESFKTHLPGSLPLAWASIYADYSAFPPHKNSYSVSDWTPGVSRSEYGTNVEIIREHIAAGDTYQVNYSFPLFADFVGDSFLWYSDLCNAQGASFSAYLDLGRYQVLSISPELFFERTGDRVRTKPMKGTVRRGRWKQEDEQLAYWLQNSEKNRAENVMIVDLLRNDLGRVAIPGSVKVPATFELERFETLWQMTSTVEAKIDKQVSLAQLIRALFPCGSITGAPKIRTMELIKGLERFPRGAYTGTIGLIKPGGDCVFNVAIRTVVLDSETRKATIGVGGGVTYDSTAESEYDECLLKSNFLKTRTADFDLFESILLQEGQYFLLNRHLQRLQNSAEFFGFQFPQLKIEATLKRIAEKHAEGKWKLKVITTKHGAVEAEVTELANNPDQVYRVGLAKEPVNSANRLLFHKTTARDQYGRELDQRQDCDDVIFWNESGEITETTIANVVVSIEGELFTPPVESGLLAGIYRAQLLAEGVIKERAITIEELRNAPELLLINSVRKWMKATLVDNR